MLSFQKGGENPIVEPHPDRGVERGGEAGMFFVKGIACAMKYLRAGGGLRNSC